MRRELSCECCHKLVSISNVARYRELVRTKTLPLCGQCRRYIRPASGNVPAKYWEVTRSAESVNGPSLVATGLVTKRGRGAKRITPLASQSFGRCGVSGCETVGAVDVGEC